MVVGYLSRICLCLAFLTTLATCALAQRLPLKAYSVVDGLPNNVIHKVMRDSRGFIWFCTAEGLSRFDGYSFTNFGVDQGLPHTTVNDFLETRSGELWLATNGGLVLFNPKGKPKPTVQFADQRSNDATMFTVVVPNVEDRAAKAITTLLEDREGTIWCGTMRHLYRLRNHDQLELVPVDLKTKEIVVNDLLEDDSGAIWIGTFAGLFCRKSDGRVEHFTRSDGLTDEVVQDLMRDHHGQFWAATRIGGFFRFVPADAGTPRFVAQVYNRKSGLPTDWVFQLFESSDNRFWLGTNVGLVEFFPNVGQDQVKFRTYTRRNGLTFKEITALNEDMSGNLWLGTNVSGAMKLEHNGFITYDEQDGIVTMNAIFGDRAGGICFRAFVLGDSHSTVFGGAKLDPLQRNQANALQQMGRYDERGFSWFMPNALNKDGWVFEQVTVQSQNGEWWIGTGAGLHRFPAAEKFTDIKSARPLAVYGVADGLASMQVYRVFEDSIGAIWVSTISNRTGAPNGLARWQSSSGALQKMQDSPGLPSPNTDLALSFGEDAAKNVWIGFGSGVARYREGSFYLFTTKDGLPPGGVGPMYLDRKGRLWLSSLRSGLIRTDDSNADHPHFVSYTIANGLSSNATQAITEDLLGRIYVGTGRGVDQLDPETGSIKHFTTNDGVPGGTLNAAFRDRNGVLWFGTQKGLARFVPTADVFKSSPPILIEALRISDTPQHISALGEQEISLPDFPAGPNQIQISFVGLNFAPGEVLRYQYKLEGTDDDWSSPTEQRTVNYANLARGRYRFLVRAVAYDGTVSSTPAQISFTILPPFWLRWWFLTLTGLLLVSIAYAGHRYRLRRALELERVRTRIAADLHDDIGSNLSLIAGLSEMLNSQVRNTNGQIAERLSVIATVSRRSVDAMSDIVWAVNPKRDNVLDLAQRMRRFASDTLSARNIEFHFKTPGAENNVAMNAEVRRQSFLIFKEAINNVARHSGCKSAEAMLKVERGIIILELRDDGRGFDDTNGDEGHGLGSMRQRAEKLGGKLEVASKPGEGTTITLKAPVGRHA